VRAASAIPGLHALQQRPRRGLLRLPLRRRLGARGGARLIRQDCPRSDQLYAPDQFSGTVHALREVYQSRNNDGAYDIDEPYTFRRVACE